jgi:HEAT repeat protein
MKPFFRAAAAHTLGRLDATDARELLVDTVGNLDNAPAVRREAAAALARMADRQETGALRRIAAEYPERATRRALLEAPVE